MIHPRRGGGMGAYVAAFVLFDVCVVIAVVAVLAGDVELGVQVPWKAVVMLAIVAAIAGWARLRRGSAG